MTEKTIKKTFRPSHCLDNESVSIDENCCTGNLFVLQRNNELVNARSIY